MAMPGPLKPAAAAGHMPATSILVCMLLASTYVGSLYITPATAQQLRLHLTEPAWWKILGTLLAALLSILVARTCFAFVPPQQPNCLSDAQILGVSLAVDSVWWDLAMPLLATACLLLPLIAANMLVILYKESAARMLSSTTAAASELRWYFGTKLPAALTKLAWRIAHLDATAVHALLLGPLAEELCFRAALLPILMVVGGWSFWPANLIAAALFALAHAHSLLGPLLQTGTLPAGDLGPVLVQCAFTGLFGLYAGTIFMVSRCIWTCFLCHSLCNLVGFPDFELVLRLPGPVQLGLGAASGLSLALGFALLRLL